MDIGEFGAILKAHGIRHGAGVPCSFFTPLVNYMTVDPQLDYLSASSEGEAVAVAAGLVAAGKPAFALMQNSGLGNAVNPVTSLLYIYDIPVVLLVSHRGQAGLSDEPQHELMGQITEELSRLIALQTHTLVDDPALFAAELTAAQERGLPAAWICPKGVLKGGPKAPPIELALHSRAVSPGSAGVFRPELYREQALERLLPYFNAGLADGLAPAVVGTTGKLSRELYELDDRDHSKRNRFYMVGSMGCAAGFGLGVARGLSDRPVIVLDGDGALLLKLGSLAAIGHHGPVNLHHIVFDNGAHDSTGGQPTLSTTVDFATMALAAGYRDACTVSSPRSLVEVFERQLAMSGPTLLRVAIRTGSRKDLGRPTHAPKDRWRWFSDYLQGVAA